MRYVDEFRDAEIGRKLASAISQAVTRPWTIMEVCGGQTHAIVRFGIDRLLPDQIELVHGPGCPVCVTPVELIDRAISIASMPNVTFCSFGDMLRVPGSRRDLLTVKANGGDVRTVYSPMDALKLARQLPDREVVFFGVGFETTAPANGMTVYQAKQEGIGNYSLLASHVLVPPAIEAVLGAGECRVQGLLAAGHVCTVMGWGEYEPIAERHGAPIVVTGFEPADVLRGILVCVQMLEAGRHEVANAYARSVRREGNPTAVGLMREVFRVVDRKWRGIGVIPRSGLAIAPAYAEWDAEARFGVAELTAEEPSECISGLVLQGVRKPSQCPAFGSRCTPEKPLGATMVSSEGACAAYYRYRRSEPAGAVRGS